MENKQLTLAASLMAPGVFHWAGFDRADHSGVEQ